MNHIPDLISLLCLDPRFSVSPFGGQHRTILISRDFSNTGDFVFNNLLQSFSRKQPNTPILLVTINHDWTNYSASAAKCGFNLRRSTNNGNIDVLDVMTKIYESFKDVDEKFDICGYIFTNIVSFIERYTTCDTDKKDTEDAKLKPLVIMIDDLTSLISLGIDTNKIYQLFSSIEHIMRERSKGIQDSRHLSHFIVQTLMLKTDSRLLPDNVNYMISNMENISDISMILKPLETGYSTRVDGTIKIVDNRLPISNSDSQKTTVSPSSISLFPTTNSEIGIKKAFFFKLSDRKVRLTSSALLF